MDFEDEEAGVALHPAVKAVAKDIELVDGKMLISETNVKRHRVRLGVLKTPDDKKQAIVSLLALATRLMREGGENTAPAVARLMDLTTGLIGDPAKAKALFDNLKK